MYKFKISEEYFKMLYLSIIETEFLRVDLFHFNNTQENYKYTKIIIVAKYNFSNIVHFCIA